MAGITWQPNLIMGAGFDKVRGEAKQVGVTGTATTTPGAGGQEGDTAVLVCQTTEQFDDAVDIHASVGGGFGLIGGNAKFDFKKRSKVSNQSTFCLIRVRAMNAYEQLMNPKLEGSAFTLIKNSNWTRFRERFGDQFASGQWTGVEFYGAVRIEAKTVEQQLNIAASLQASYGLAVSGRASTNINQSMNSSEHRIEITTYQKGGLVNICNDLNELFTLAQDALNESRSGRGYPFSVELDSYTELELPNDNASFIDAEFARRELEKLSKHMNALDRMSNDIAFVLGHQEWFEDVDVSRLNTVNGEINTQLNNIREAADVCATDFDKCKAYAPVYPEFVLPLRKSGIQTFATPPFVGLILPHARAMASQLHLHVEDRHSGIGSHPLNFLSVIEQQDPAPGTPILPGSTVVVYMP